MVIEPHHAQVRLMRLSQVRKRPAGQIERGKTSTHHSMKTTIHSINILAIFLAAILLSACGQSLPNTPEAVAKQFVTAMFKQDFKTMAACATKDQQSFLLNKTSTKPMAENIKKQLEDRGGLKSVETSPVSVSDQKATVKVTIVFETGKNIETTQNLVKEDGVWKVFE